MSLVEDLKVPEFTAHYLLAMIDSEKPENRSIVFPDERAMRAAKRRGLVEETRDGWVLTDLCRDWAQAYRTPRLVGSNLPTPA